jgi:hypothetical protein
MCSNLKFCFIFSLKLIYKRTHMIKEKCLKVSKSVQKCPNISNQNLYSLFNLTLNKMDTYLSKCKI